MAVTPGSQIVDAVTVSIEYVHRIVRVKAQIAHLDWHRLPRGIDNRDALDGEVHVGRALVRHDERAPNAEAAGYPPALNLRGRNLAVVRWRRGICEESHKR